MTDKEVLEIMSDDKLLWKSIVRRRTNGQAKTATREAVKTDYGVEGEDRRG